MTKAADMKKKKIVCGALFALFYAGWGAMLYRMFTRQAIEFQGKYGNYPSDLTLRRQLLDPQLDLFIFLRDILTQLVMLRLLRLQPQCLLRKLRPADLGLLQHRVIALDPRLH